MHGADELSDQQLLDIHAACRGAAAKAHSLLQCVTNNAAGHFRRGWILIEGKVLSPQTFRDVFDNKQTTPPMYWRAKMEFDAASEGAVVISAGRFESNWHEAIFLLYRLILHRLWTVLLGDEKSLESLVAFRIGDHTAAMNLLGDLDVQRMDDNREQLKVAFKAFTIDLQMAQPSLDREVARVLHMRALRPNRSLLVGLAAAQQIADESENLVLSMPDSADVRDLCHLLNKNAGNGIPLIQIAREFTKETPGDDGKAKSLLRQARRYSHLWRRSDS